MYVYYQQFEMVNVEGEVVTFETMKPQLVQLWENGRACLSMVELKNDGSLG
jgi:hypothetical protein